MEKELQKKLSFVLFVMAVFFAGMSLTVFQAHIWMSCIAGILLLAAAVFYVLNQEKGATSPTGKTSELLFADRMAELMRGNEKAEKGVYLAVKKQHEAMESGMETLEEKLEALIKAQENAVKTLVMYNKENAKQMALSEREELARVREELKQLQQGGGSAESMSSVVEAIRDMSRRLYEELHENFEAMLAELGTTVDSLEEMKELLQRREEAGPVMRVAASSVMTEPEKPVMTAYKEPEEEPLEPEPMAFEESEEEPLEPEPMAFEMPTEEPEEEFMPMSYKLPGEEEPEEEFMPTTYKLPGEEEEPIVEESVAEEPMDMFAGSGVDLSDPNKPLSADDIAALFAQASEVSEPAVTEDVVTEEPTDMFAGSGVDLSDPNKPLSADDIAALFAQANGASEPAVTEEEPVAVALPEVEEPVEEKKPEDAFASSGVDLSDPNKPLSADDIAALFASMGN